MARRVYFSYHYERDIFRVNQVRQCWRMHRDRTSAGFFDAAELERVQRASERAIRNWIDDQLHGTSVTVVLIGAETATRQFVHYEIQESIRLGKGLLGISLHNMNDILRGPEAPGANPFMSYREGQMVPIYDWIGHREYHNIGDWVEDAARAVRR